MPVLLPLFLALLGCPGEGVPCSSTRDCVASEICFDKRCRPVCNVHSDCPSSTRCHEGVCLELGGTCNSSAECSSAERCAEGVCRLVCRNDSDCATGDSCVAGLCLAATDAGMDASSETDAATDAGHPDHPTEGGSRDRATDGGTADSGDDASSTDRAHDASSTDRAHDASSTDRAYDAALPTALTLSLVATPPGGECGALAAPRSGEPALYALFDGGRLLRTTSPSVPWSICGYPGGEAGALAVTPDDGNTIYLAITDDVMVSSNGCASWEPTHLAVEATALVVLPGGDVLAGTEQGLWRFAGGSWAEVPSILDDGEVRDLVTSVDGQVVYAAVTDLLIARSDDGGAVWVEAAAGLPDNANPRDLALDPLDPNHILVVGSGLFYSTDGGGLWTQSSSLGRNHLYGVALNPLDGDVVIVTHGSGVDVSEDGGASFSTDRRSDIWRDARSLAVFFDPQANHRLYAAADIGVMMVDPLDPASVEWTWQPLDDGPSAWNLRSVAVTPAGDALYLATSAGILAADGAGQPWTVITDGFASYSFVNQVTLDRQDLETLYASAKLGLYRYSPGSPSLVYDYNISSGWGGRSAWVEGDRRYAGSDLFFVSWDAGAETWEEHQIQGERREVRDILVDEAAPVAVSIATASGVFRTEDDGLSFEPLGTGLSGDDASVSRLLRLDDGSLLAASVGGVFRLSADEEAWQPTSLSGVAGRDLLTRDGHAVAATEAGLYTSDDGGMTWDLVPGTGALQPSALACDDAGILYVGTRSWGFFRSEHPLSH